MLALNANSHDARAVNTAFYTLCELASWHSGAMAKPHPALYGFSINDLVEICKVDITTARRWKRGAFCPPKTALMMLARDLGCFSEYWAGWTINGPDIVSPEGWTIDRNQALTVPLHHGLISALRQQVAELKRQVAAADATSHPANQDWVLEVTVGPPGQLRTLRASLREFNNSTDALLLPAKVAK